MYETIKNACFPTLEGNVTLTMSVAEAVKMIEYAMRTLDDKPKDDSFLDTPLSTFIAPTQARSLRYNEIVTLRDAMNAGKIKMARTKNVGGSTILKIRTILSERGYELN